LEEHNMTDQNNKTSVPSNDRTTSWRLLLRDALTTPGAMHEAYRRFHRYSLRNQLLAMAQCQARGITPGPLATLQQWRALGRSVLRGEKALVLCMPVRRKHEAIAKSDDEPADDEPAVADVARPFFVHRARWFVLSQTDGEAYEAAELPSWNEAVALHSLGIERVAFDAMDGNAQGYSVGQRIAINPVAALPSKTLFHEVAHIILGHTAPGCVVARNVQELEAESVALLCLDALDLPGAEYCRGYVQAWATSDDLTDDVASRIMTAADAVLRAGQAPAPLDSTRLQS
jgi:antirestriction protein ArdC